MRLARVWPLVAVSLAALPPPAAADARDYPGHSVTAPSSSHSGRATHTGRFQHHRGTIVVFPSPFYYAPPVYSAPPVYAPPPMIYAPPVAYAAPPAAYAPPATAYAPPPAPAAPPPPMPRTVEFGSGRYELRGDGVTSPYVWVWIPNPPTAPPPGYSAPSTAPALYRWTDERGVATWTDDLQKVPARFRAQAAQTPP